MKCFRHQVSYFQQALSQNKPIIDVNILPKAITFFSVVAVIIKFQIIFIHDMCFIPYLLISCRVSRLRLLVTFANFKTIIYVRQIQFAEKNYEFAESKTVLLYAHNR